MPNTTTRYLLLRALGILLSVVPPMVCTLLYFPVFRAAGGEELICGGAVLLLIICALPAFRYLKEHLRSPSVPLLWGACFLLFFALSKIAEEMIVISFVGWISNLAAAVAFRLSDRWKVKPDVGV